MAPVVPRIVIAFRVEGFSCSRHQRLSDFSVGIALGVSVGTGAFTAVRIWTADQPNRTGSTSDRRNRFAVAITHQNAGFPRQSVLSTVVVSWDGRLPVD